MSNKTSRMTLAQLAAQGGLAGLRSSANGNPLRGIAEAAIAKAEKAAAEGKRTYGSPESYAAANPLGGPAVIFDSMASRVRAGEDFYHVLADCGFQESPETANRQNQAGRAVKTQPAQREARKPTSGESARVEIRAGAVEKEVQSAICALLDAYRIPYAVTDAAEVYNRRGQRIQRLTPGWPDVTACNPDDGRFIALECKRAKGGQLRYDQAVTLERLHEAGALVIIARSIDDVISAFETRRTSDATLAEIAAALNRGPKLKRGKL